MNKPKSDKILTRKPKSREPLYDVFPLLVAIDVEVGADDNVDESNEEYWLVDDAVMVFLTTTPKRGGHSQGERMHKYVAYDAEREHDSPRNRELLSH